MSLVKSSEKGKSMGILSKIKADTQKSGGNKAKLIYFREGQKRRIRFLQDMDDGMEVVMHDSYDLGVNVVCQKTFGKHCDFCGDDNLRTRSNYCWSVWDYDANEVVLFFFPVNRCSPIPPLMAMYENYGTITDRDYVITVSGKQSDKSYSVVPMDKVKFRNTKAKPMSKKQVLDILKRAFPLPTDYKPEGADSDFENDDSTWDDDDEQSNDYSSMKPMELYKLCVERDIEAEKRKPAKYYINLLEEADKADDDWGDDEEDEADDFDDEWEDE